MASNTIMYVALAGIVIGFVIATFFVHKEIVEPLTGEFCDANNPCRGGETCYKFPTEAQAICLGVDPCQKCASKQCTVSEAIQGDFYPKIVICRIA
ncbi:hypothetical protein HYX10_06615 [Candidatus Woesearchaeota archaeon]|nr:hypothetical protein [Candidatus Woesearchaeota archaeon]